MERLFMILHHQDQYCENGCATESNLQSQHSYHQNPNVIFHRNRKLNPQTHMAKVILTQNNTLEVSQYQTSNCTTELL
jgi:hypothetical protein